MASQSWKDFIVIFFMDLVTFDIDSDIASICCTLAYFLTCDLETKWGWEQKKLSFLSPNSWEQQYMSLYSRKERRTKKVAVFSRDGKGCEFTLKENCSISGTLFSTIWPWIYCSKSKMSIVLHREGNFNKKKYRLLQGAGFWTFPHYYPTCFARQKRGKYQKPVKNALKAVLLIFLVQ